MLPHRPISLDPDLTLLKVIFPFLKCVRGCMYDQSTNFHGWKGWLSQGLCMSVPQSRHTEIVNVVVHES